MLRFLIASLVAFVLVLAPTIVSAQDLPMPGRGEILELRRDDPRNQQGYRSFIFGSWTPGMGGLATILGRVNADIEGDRRVTMEQLEAANPCIVIYHRADRRAGRNGSCDANPTRERLTLEAYCEGDRSCSRWPMSRSVYRIPARPRLTPGERAEEMVSTLDGTTVSNTVPAPAELGSWMTELSDLMGEEQAPSNDQVRNVLAAVGRTLIRTPVTPVGTSVTTPVPNAVHGTSPNVVPLHPTNTQDGTATSILMNPNFLWLIIAIMSVALILLLLKDKILAWYRPTTMDDEAETPKTETAPPSPTPEQERDKKFFESLERLWKQYRKHEVLTVENLIKFFVKAGTDDQMVVSYGQVLLARAEAPIPEVRIEYRENTTRIDELMQELAAARRELEDLKNEATKLVMVPEVPEPPVTELAGEETNLGAVIPGFGGAEAIPSYELASEELPVENTKPGVRAPELEDDEKTFRMSQHAPPVGRSSVKTVGRAQRRRERERKTTVSFEGPNASPPPAPQSLAQPPLPVIVPAAEHGEDSDPRDAEDTAVFNTEKK